MLGKAVVPPLLIIASFLAPQYAMGLGPQNSTCWEIGTCPIWQHPLQTMIQPWVDVWQVGNLSFFYVIFWGIIVGVIWLRTHHTMIAGIVGVALAGMFSFDQHTLLVGGVLLAASIGIILYQLIIVRSNYPTN
jgi:hypothetical protein